MCSMRAYNVDGKSAKWNLAKYLVCLLWKDIYPSKICLIDPKLSQIKAMAKKESTEGFGSNKTTLCSNHRRNCGGLGHMPWSSS